MVCSFVGVGVINLLFVSLAVRSGFAFLQDK